MKKFFLYMTAALMMAACSSEGDVLTPTVEDKDMVPEEPLTGVRATVTDVLQSGDDEPTRSSLTYTLDGKKMKFTWKSDDEVGVFPASNNGTTEIEFKLAGDLVVGETSVTGTFESQDQGVKTLAGNTAYVSYSPFLSYTAAGTKFGLSETFGYDKIPVSYEGQRQNVNVNTQAYYDRASNGGAQMTAYVNSEGPASAHLGAYDFLVSDEITTTENGGAHFNFYRMGGVVRFFFKAPAAEVFDELQLVNSDANFMLEGTMDVKTKTYTPTKTSHILTLKLGPDVKEKGNTFDMTKEGGEPVCPTSYKKDKSNAYVIAYMMVAPMTLTSLKACTLYLVGHKSSTNVTKTYYKATLGVYDILRDRVLQWAPSNNPDDPITFTPITVQEWETGTTFTNGDGNGTGGF